MKIRNIHIGIIIVCCLMPIFTLGQTCDPPPKPTPDCKYCSFDPNQKRQQQRKTNGNNNGPHGCGGCVTPTNNQQQNTNNDTIRINRVHAVDPNEIKGSTGYGDEQWMSINDELGYTIFYENDPEFATAPAQIVKITQPVDPNTNILSFRLGHFGFGYFNFDVPPNTSFYSERLDVIDSLGVYVDVTAGVDIINQELFWIFESIDPATGLPPEDALTGFLPVNDTTVGIYNDTLIQKGEGFVTYTILPENTVVTGDSVVATASIIFDDNAPLITNTWRNLIDAVAPTSVLDTLPAISANNIISLTWMAEDDVGGVGVGFYDLYVAKDGEDFYVHAENIDTTFYEFEGDLGGTYDFFIRARDFVGNEEPSKNAAEETVELGSDTLILSNPGIETQFCGGDEMNIQWTAVGLDAINIELSQDGGNSFTYVDMNVNAFYSEIEWTIPDGISCDNCVMRIKDIEGKVDPVLSDPFVINERSDTTFFTDIVCNVQDTGTVVMNLQNINGCDSVVVEIKTLSPLDTTMLISSSCNPQDTGVFVNTYNSEFGCDSIVVSTVSLLPSDTTYFFDTSCNAQDSGTVVMNLVNQFGCDSLIITTTTFFPNDTTYIFDVSCSPQDTGQFVTLLPNQGGCDSLVLTNISLAPGDTTYINLVTCDFNDVGVTNELLMNQAGCDSLIITTTTLETEPPTAICQDITVSLDDMGQISVLASEVNNGSTDNCDIASFSLDQNDFDCQTIGSNGVTLTVVDINGNQSTCSAIINIQDEEPPIAQCQDLTIELDAQGLASTTANAVDNGSTDACGISSLSLDIEDFDCGLVGMNTLTLTVTDVNGNSNTCTSQVTIEDNIAPVAQCQDLTIELDAQGIASTTASMVDNGSTDACGISSLSLDVEDFDCGVVGMNTLTLTVTDVNGNSNTCTSQVTIEDNIAPVAQCQDLTIELDAQGLASTTASMVDNGSTDACGISSLSLDIEDFDCEVVGMNTLTLTVTDVNGNSNTCTSQVTIEDNIVPVAQCQDLTIELDGQGLATTTPNAVDNGSTDACGISSLSLDVEDFDCGVVGLNTLTLTVTDVNGNSNTCTSQVTIEDNIAPVAQCQDLTIELDAQGLASTTASLVDDGSTDACGISSLSLDIEDFDCGVVGLNTLTLTVMDVNGNSNTCTSQVTIEDNIAPVAQCQDLTIELDAQGLASTTASAVDNGSTDACGISSLSLDVEDFDCGVVGMNTLTLTVTDVNGNSNTCTSQVTIEDNIAPTITCPQSLTATCDLNEQMPYQLVSEFIGAGGLASDNCSISDMDINVLSDISDGLSCPETYTRTYQITDVNGNTSTCQQTIIIDDDILPIAICQDITVVLDNNGNVAVSPQMTDAGSSDNCGNIDLSLNNVDFSCSDVGPRSVELIVTDDCGNSSSCSANVNVIWSNGCPEPGFSNNDSPMISDPCTCRTNGEFDEEVHVEAPSGQGNTWVVKSTTLLDPITLQPFAPGTPLIETDLGNGMSQYSIAGVHLDGIGYEIFVENPTFYPNLVLDISNVCYYPKPEIVGIANPYCLNSPIISLQGDAGGAVLVSETFTINGQSTTTFDPQTFGIGNYQVIYTVDAGTAGSMDPSDPGCMATASEFIQVVETSSNVICNAGLQATLDENCEVFINPDMVLEGTYECFDDYVVEIKLNGNTVGNPVDGAYIGESLIVEVTHLVSGNSCWGNLTIEDKSAPVIDCSSTPVTVVCTADIDSVNPPNFEDNCDQSADINLIDEITLDNDICDDGIIQIQKTWLAVDNFGNQSSPCIQIIEITRPTEIDFPDDIVWTCDQYDAFQNIVEPSLLNPSITDSDLTTPSKIEVTLDPVNDANILGQTGSGLTPDIGNANCFYNFTTSDQILNDCGSSFKIIRTWTVMDWCTNEIITLGANGEDNIQIIKITDDEPPLVDITSFEVNANVGGAHPTACKSTDLLLPPTISDNCNDWTVKILTPIGEAVYVNGNDGKQGGFIPNPGLGIGTHEITYQAIDGCGNVGETKVEITVSDKLAPNVICDELTEVTLSSNGLAEVEASVFDDGSFDNCCLDYFEVKRMEDNCNISSNLEFGSSVTFCCDDAGQGPIQIVVRAYDCYDNYNDCMVEVNIDDKLPPILTDCPPAQTINCDYYWDEIEVPYSLGDLTVFDEFGWPSFVNNCTGNTDYQVNVNIDNCGIGNIVRTWSSMDTLPGSPSNTCTQIISIEHISDWVVEFPSDQTVSCGDTLPDFGNPNVTFETCELIAVSYEDVYFDVVPDACYKIARQWTVINWCVVGEDIDQEMTEVSESQLGLPFPDCDLDGDGDCDDLTFQDSRTQNGVSDTDPDLDNYDGYITYEQTIKVSDDVAPVLTCTDIESCIEDSSCGVDIILPEPDVIDCSPDITFTVSSNLPNFDSDNFNAENVEPGIYSATYTGMDNCGNSSSCQIQIEVADCKKPTPYCSTGIIVELMPTTNEVSVGANALNEGSFDNCSDDLLISFSDEINDTERVYNCDNLGQNQVEIWVTDEAGNQDYCTTTVIVQANMADCDQDGLVIGGGLETEIGQPVEFVNVQLSGDNDMVMVSSNDGQFEFSGVLPNGDYTITPKKDINPLNGVTTYDLVLMTKHILNVEKLDTPYKMIAADVNKSSTITTMDLVALRKVILHVDSTFQNNESWRFIEKDYEFPNSDNPFEEAFPEITNLNNLSIDKLDNHFIGVKIGDVNNSASPNELQNSDDRSERTPLFWETENQRFEEGELVKVDFKARDFNLVLGYQFTIEFDSDMLELEGFENFELKGLGLPNFGLTLLDKGIITTSWNGDPTILKNEDLIFSLVLKARQKGVLENVLTFGSRYTPSEAYIENQKVTEVQLRFTEPSDISSSDSIFKLYQNQPNPFSKISNIGFDLPASDKVELTIFDESGVIIWEFENDFESGYNEITISHQDLIKKGVLFYQMETSFGKAIKKMLVLE